MGRALIGYERGMRRNRKLEVLTLLFLTGSLAFGITACGSSDSSPDDESAGKSEVEVAPEKKNATEGAPEKKGEAEVTPEKKAPDSAKDKRKNAPDDVISERPGGPAPSPVSP